MKKVLVIALAAMVLPLTAAAQSSYEEINDTAKMQQHVVSINDLLAATQETAADKAYRESFTKDLTATAQKINENATQWAAETAKRGYPKKKTVKAKAELVDHYVFLLGTQLSDSRLNRFIDKAKVQDKITYWKNYREQLNKLM